MKCWAWNCKLYADHSRFRNWVLIYHVWPVKIMKSTHTGTSWRASAKTKGTVCARLQHRKNSAALETWNCGDFCGRLQVSWDYNIRYLSKVFLIRTTLIIVWSTYHLSTNTDMCEEHITLGSNQPDDNAWTNRTNNEERSTSRTDGDGLRRTGTDGNCVGRFVVWHKKITSSTNR